MSGLQRVDPIAQRLIKGAIEAEKTLTIVYRDQTFMGQDVESLHISVDKGEMHVSQISRRPPVLGDWLAVIGAGFLFLFSFWLLVQAVKGVMKSDNGMVQTSVVWVDPGGVLDRGG